VSKKKTKSESTNTYQYLQPPDTQDIKDLRSMDIQEDPGIGHQFALLKENVHNSYMNPLGAYTTPDVREKQLRATDMDINQQETQAHRVGQYDVNQQRIGKQTGLAALTAPKLAQTGGTQTTTQSGDILGQIIGAGAQVGSAALM
jgi:hypothetical protein